jgi:hypothetical protein
VSPLKGSGACGKPLEEGKGENFKNQEGCVPEQKLAPNGLGEFLEGVDGGGTIAEPSSESPMNHPGTTIVRLPRNGPKPGQSVSAWLYGKDRNCQRERDAAKWKPNKKGA